MSRPVLQILHPGIFTTVQDRGRYGFQRYGVPVSGAMDQFALRAANLLAGNGQGAACLEMTVIGPTARLLSDATVAITGADLTPTVDGRPLPRWEPAALGAGSVLSFPEMRDGVRCYLSISGGIDVPEVLGSRSTYVKADLGGLEGRALLEGDVISAFDDAGPVREAPTGFEAPSYGRRHNLRVVMGPQDDAFDDDAVAALLESEYTVSLDSDRVGYRLEGPRISHRTRPDIISDGTPAGAIQVPGDGSPTVLLADRGATGGYTKIATVISTDVDRLGQALPGQTVAFEALDVEDAHRAMRGTEALISAFAGLPPPSVSVDGEPFDVLDLEGRIVAGRLPWTAGARSTRRLARATIGGRTYEFEVSSEGGPGGTIA